MRLNRTIGLQFLRGCNFRMKKIVLAAAIALLGGVAFLNGTNLESGAALVLAAEEQPVITWDFTKELAKKNSSYTTSFTTDGYTLYGVNNNSSKGCVWVGGGKSKSEDTSTITWNSPIDSAISRVAFSFGTLSTKGGFSINTISISAKFGETTYITEYEMAGSATYFEISLENAPWEAGGLYTVSFDWTNDSGSNARAELKTIDFYGSAAPDVETVTVEDISLLVGFQKKLEAVISPTTASKDLEWSIDDPTIALVDSENGTITGLKEGVAVVRATASNGVYGEAFVTVSEIPTYDVLPLEIFPDSFDPYDSQIGNVRNELTLDNGLEIAHIANYSSYKIGNEQYDEIQLYKGIGYIENIVALPNIVAIELEAVPNESSTFNEPIVTVGTSLEENGDVAIAGANKGYTYRYDMPEGYSYFKIAAHSSTSTFFVSMTVYVESMIDTYSEFFLLEDMCDENGIVPPNTESWSSLQSAFEKLGELDKIAFRNAVANQSEDASNISQCVARYDYIVGKYTSELYADFMNRDPRAPASAYYGNDRNSAIDSTAIVFASLCVLAIGSGLGYFFYRKRKQA